MRVALLALLLALVFPKFAIAQQWNKLVSIELEGLNRSMTRNGAPYDKPSSSDNAAFRVRDGKLIGVTVAVECQSKPNYQGSIGYSLKGGQLSSAGPCDMSSANYAWHVDYKWSSNATLSGGKLTLKGQGTAVKTTVRGCSGNWCGPDITEFVEQAVLRLTDKGCTIESYSRTETLKSSNGVTVLTTYSSNARSRCRYED
jgi:hypothetical protein